MTFSRRTLRAQPSTASAGHKKKPFLSGGVLLFLVILLAWQGFEYRYRQLIQAENPGPETARLFEIPGGSTLGNIAAKLEEEGFISSSWAFRRYVDRQGRAEDFQAGRFYLPQNLPPTEVAARLLDTNRRENLFTIPEGLTLEEIDARLAERGYAEPGVFLKCIRETCDFSEYSFLPRDRREWEGYFFPETYAVLPESFSAEDLARKMLDEFARRAKTLGILEREDLAQLVIMASLVEKESRKNEERPVIAGILWKRLREDWLLGVDATVRYFTGKKTEPLTEADLSEDNPYNTRKHPGLPPTAICNPGESSLSAAANPQESPYYYYLHGKDGGTYFAVTNEEHNRNKQKHL